MFWQSSNSSNRHYDSSDSDSSADTGATLWSRSKPPPKHKRSPKSSPSNQSSWLPQWFAPSPPPSPPKRSHHQRHRKPSKPRSRSCRPKTRHGWGIVFLSILLILYLVDFFKILYTDQSHVPKVSVKDSIQHPSVDEAGTVILSNDTNRNGLAGTDSLQKSDVQGADNNGEQVPAPAVAEPNTISGQLPNTAQGISSGTSDVLTGSRTANGGLLSSADLSSSSLGGPSSLTHDYSSRDSLSRPPLMDSSTNSFTSSSVSSSGTGGDSSQSTGVREWRDSMSQGNTGSSNTFQQVQPEHQQFQNHHQQQQPPSLQQPNENFNTMNNNAGGLNSGHGLHDSVVGDSGTREELIKHPMNRNMPELHVPDNIGTLSFDSIKNYYRTLSKAYLSSFSNGIYRQMYFDILRRRTYSLTPPGANKGVQSMLFQIIGKKVYMMDPYEVPRNSKPFYRTRINEVIWMLSRLATQGRIKDTEFLISIHDCVQTVNQAHTYRGAHYQESNPSFTIVNCNFSNNIPFPMWEGSRNRGGGFSGWDLQMKEYAQDDITWERKLPKAVFRGGIRPSMYFKNKSEADEHCSEVGRTRLLHLSKMEPELLDVSIGGTCGGVHSILERLEPRDHHKYKYIMYAEGNCMWADRTRQQLFGPSMLIKQETPCGQFFEPLLKPFTHYIPTDFFFTDTVDKVKWAKDHDEEAKAIVKNANEFALNFLSLQGIESYVEALLEEYTALLVEPDIKLETGAIDVTNRQV